MLFDCGKLKSVEMFQDVGVKNYNTEVVELFFPVRETGEVMKV